MTQQDLASDTKPRANKSYKLGVALSGGGARGIAHAGALKAIEEAGLKPDIIAGVSSGSVAAVLYAAGVKPDTILEMFEVTKLRDFVELGWGNRGLIRMEPFIRFITRSLGDKKRLEDLRIPCHIGVTNFDTGLAEQFSTGEIGPIMQASCSIPVAFPPVEINGTTYVDGGVVRNLPAWTIRDKCEKLIGINVSPVTKMVEHARSIFGIAMRTYTLLAKSNQLPDMKMCDLVVTTNELTHLTVFNLRDARKIFNTGYLNMRKTLRDAGWWHPAECPIE